MRKNRLWRELLVKGLKKRNFRASFEPFAADRVVQIAAMRAAVGNQDMLAQQTANVRRGFIRSNIVTREYFAFTLLQNKILYAILASVDCSARE
jgi:hypothetical protein